MAQARFPHDDEALALLSARDLAAAVPDPIVMVDERGAVRHANAAALSFFGPIPQGTILTHRFRSPDMRRLMDAVLGEGRAEAIDYGERVPIERAFRVFATPLGGGSGLFMVHFKDQSETRRIDRMRADFIANASHELRTPLASISGFIETLRGPARNDEKARDSFLGIMQAQTARMARLIDDLLTLSRIEMKPRLPSRERIDLGDAIAGVVDSLGYLAAEHGVEIVFARPPAPAFVSGSRDELIQVFVNLLENACKYGAAGGRVDIAIERVEEGPAPEIAVTVRDHGPGIAEEHIPRITERFYRIGGEKNGTGLGLAIVKHILTRHDGRLGVRSRPGEGAAFTVYLPEP